MKKIISFCVYGNAPIFLIGAIRNAELAQKIYPDWVCRFYIFTEAFSIKEDLEKFPNVETVCIGREGGAYSMLYRFLPLEEENIEYFISRDTDSRLSFREKESVDKWIESGKTFHIMKDHPYHITPEFPILGGMWGSKGGIIKDIRSYMSQICQNLSDEHGLDQKFLYNLYHKHALNDHLTHNPDEFPSPRNYERDNIYFVGQVIDENEKFGGNWKNDLSLLNINL